MMICTDAGEIIAWASARNAAERKQNATARRANRFFLKRGVFVPLNNF